MSKRADQLQFLRFCAFGLIFLWHADKYSLSFFPGPNGAANGVAFFIVLSGFVSGYSSYSKDITFSIKNTGGYLVKKIKMVYPLYFLTTVFAISYSGLPELIAYHKFGEAAPLIKQLVINLVLLQSWFPQGYFSYNGVGWFLSTVMFLYLIYVPVSSVMTGIRKKPKSNLWFGVIAVLAFLITAAYCYINRNTNVEFTEYIFPVSRVGEYICGMSLGYMVFSLKDKLDKRECTLPVMTIAEVLAFVLWIYWMYRPVGEWQFRIFHWFIPNCILLIVFGFGKGLISRVFRIRPLKFLGDISFECFLIHQILINIYTPLSGLENESTLGNLFSIVFCLVITILMAALISNAKKRR